MSAAAPRADEGAEPSLHIVRVCELCACGAGGECHVPGCAFWMHDAPTGDTLAAIAGQVYTRPASSGDGGAPTPDSCLFIVNHRRVETCGQTEASHVGDSLGHDFKPWSTAPSPVSEEGPPTRPAMRWDGSRASLDRLCKWVNAGTDADDPLLAYTFYTATDAWDVTLETDSDFEGVEPGDWIVCDETGEFVVCRPGTPEQGEGPAK